MIVRDAPYELVCLFADADAQKFVEKLVLRGQERGCLRRANVRFIRDPKRDIAWRDPLSLLQPPIAEPGRHRVLVCWDEQGSGNEDARQSVQHVRLKFEHAGFPSESVCVACFAPELEAVLSPVSQQALDLFAGRRGVAAPSDEAILQRLAKTHRLDVASRDAALRDHPKEWVSAALQVLRLKRAPDIYEELGQRLSLPVLKQHPTAAQIAEALQRWFSRLEAH